MQTILNNIQMFLDNDIKTLLLSIIWFFSISLLLAYFLNKKQSETYVLSYIVSGLVLYIGGLFKHISIMYYTSWIVILLTVLVLLIRKKGRKLIDNIDLFSSITFFVVLLILFVVYQNIAFRYTDEFMHWGPMVREMARINKFYCEVESNLLVHKDYPPFFSIIELLFCLFKGEYVEKYLYIGLISFVYSIILAVVSRSNKTILFKIIDILIFALSGLIFQYLPNAKDSIGIYNSIYIDYVLAFYIFYLIYKLIKDKSRISILEYSLLFSALLLTKQISIYFFVICVMIALLNNKNSVNKVLFCLIIPALFFVFWKVMVNMNSITGQFSLSNFGIRQNIVTIIVNYVKALVIKPLFVNPFNLSFILCFVILTALFIILLKNKRISKYEGLVLVIGLFVYAMVIGFMYCFVFSVEEALSLASYERYLLTYLFTNILLVIYLAIENNNLFVYMLVFGFVILLADFNNSYIYKITDSKEVLVIRQWGEEIELDKPKDNGSSINFVKRDYIDDNIDHNELLKEISTYNYLYIFKYDDMFYQHWKDYTNGALLENDSLYYINKENNNIEFIDDKYSSIYYEIIYYLHIK